MALFAMSVVFADNGVELSHRNLLKLHGSFVLLSMRRQRVPLADKVSPIIHIKVNRYFSTIFNLLFLENVSGGHKAVENVAWNARITLRVTTVLVLRLTTRRVA